MGRPRMPELGVEVLLAAGLTVVAAVGVGTELSYADHRHPAGAGAYTIAIAAAAALIWRRRRPVLVSTIVLVLLVGYHAAGYPGFAPALAMFVAIYSVAAYGRPPVSMLWCGLLLAGTWLIPTLPPNEVSWTSFGIIGPVTGLAWTVVVGLAARQRRVADNDRTARAEATAEAESGRRIAEERLRIARELHDVLAHTISVISVQAGTALDHLDTDPDRARVALRHVRAAAKQAMPELRAAVGPLRADVVAAPQPGLDQLADLIATARLTGLRADLACAPVPGDLSPHVELTVYRIVQESLTNVVRHAHAGAVEVSVRVERDAVVVEILDDGTGTSEPERGEPGRGEPGAAGTGFGIVGMRERAGLLGGRLDAGPVPVGGFRVVARLPIAETT